MSMVSTWDKFYLHTPRNFSVPVKDAGSQGVFNVQQSMHLLISLIAPPLQHHAEIFSLVFLLYFDHFGIQISKIMF